MGCVHEASYQGFSARMHRDGARRGLPLSGTLALTYRCNLRCPACYAVPQESQEELSTGEIFTILDGCAQAGCLWLLLTGGEPLLRADFPEIYLYAKSKGFLITLFTNGTCLTPDLADVLKEYPPFYVEISLYGVTEATYATATGVRGMQARCLQGIRLLLERGIYLKLKTTVTRANQHELWQIRDFVKGELKREFRLDGLIWRRLNGDPAPYALRLPPQDLVALDVADEDRRESWEEVFRAAKHVPVSSTTLACGKGRSAFDIDPYGALRVCDLLRAPSVDLREVPFSEAWNRFSASGDLVPSAPKDARCRTCAKYMFCDICPAWTQWQDKEGAASLDYLCEVAMMRSREFSDHGMNNNLETPRLYA